VCVGSARFQLVYNALRYVITYALRGQFNRLLHIHKLLREVGFDTATPMGRFVLRILASIAQLERDTIRERSQLGMRRAARR
jgi:DNA invertase Pin-like site-specific DNA recombinase